jgi:hypothetical protein
VNAQTTKLISQTLNSADADTAAAMRLLGGQVARDKSAKPLDPMKVWAPRQLKRLQGIAASAPAGAVKARADVSVNKLVQVWSRTLALVKTAQCACIGSAGSDTLGPMPCSPCAAPGRPGGGTGSAGPSTASAPSSSTARGYRTAGGSAVTGVGGGTSNTGGGASTGRAGTGPPGSAPPTSAVSTNGAAPTSGSSSGSGQPGQAPTLPSVSNPVASVGSCHVSIDAGPLHIAITVCPSASP